VNSRRGTGNRKPETGHRTPVTGHRSPNNAIPPIGLGTFGSDKYSGEQVSQAVIGAAEVGYRHFDCAAVYGNEHLIGPSLNQIVRAGIPREQLWVTSKLWNDKHSEQDVIPAFEKSLSDLGLDYLDLYLIHWPFPNFHAPGVEVSSRDPHASPYIHENYMKTWRQLEKLVRRGLVKHIGTSNMTVPKLRRVLGDAEIKPAFNEMELHPHFQQQELFEFVVESGIQPIGYSPLGSPSRPSRDRTPEDTSDMDDPVIVAVAERNGITPAEVCIKWAHQRGQVPIPFAVKKHQYEALLLALSKPPLSDAEMRLIATIDRQCRLIKGQVFLWEGAESWESLWDLDGTIAS
jgi:alcohol dehydrogenase (NADP+)